MTYFITGGTSSIGRVLIKLISERQEQARVLVRKTSNRMGIELPGIEFVTGDVTDRKSIEDGMRDCDRVCHLAAVVGANVPEAEWWKVNRDGTRNVLETALAQNIRSIVQISSLSVLLPTAPQETADESRYADPAKYFNLYQKTKRAADDLALEMQKKQGLPVKIIYPGYGYGNSFAASHPGMTDQTLLRMASGQCTAIMGSGKNRLLVSYYKDTARGILLAHENGTNGERYILGNADLTFHEIWKTIGEILGKEPPKRRLPIPMLKTINRMQKLLKGNTPFPPEFFDMVGRNWCFSFEKAKKDLKFSPGTFKETMEETWREYNQDKAREKKKD